MNAVVRPAAAADLEEAFLWYEDRQFGLGEEFMQAAEAAIREICSTPYRNPVVHGEIRRLLFRRFPYGVFYVLRSDVVVVIACMHARRDPRRWQART